MAGKNVAGVEYPLVMLVDTSGTPVDPSGGGGGGVDRELVVTTYVAINAFAGASVGDTITMTQVIDVSGTPSTVTTIWRNQTTASDLGSAPLAANIDLVGSDALTNAQLRASPVTVSSDALTNTQLRATPVPISIPVGATTTETFSTETGVFSIVAGAISYSVINTGAAPFVFQGVTIPTSVWSISGPALLDKTYPTMTGDATGTTVIVQRSA